jgi:hypothetical protein
MSTPISIFCSTNRPGILYVGKTASFLLHSTSMNFGEPMSQKIVNNVIFQSYNLDDGSAYFIMCWSINSYGNTFIRAFNVDDLLW